MSRQPPRTRPQRIRDTLARLERDVDAWVATADPEGGAPYLVPLSFMWDGVTVLVATRQSNPTGRNLRATGQVHLGIGHTRDVVVIQGTVRELPADQVSQQVGDAFAARTGFEPRSLGGGYSYFQIVPRRIRAWREANELEGRDLMLDGRWLEAD
jgi:nitroimidazol reductase NimA-like FMN-containing flavoprotein (pyridoxamine 5'-phosphate oxidase superfamily)